VRNRHNCSYVHLFCQRDADLSSSGLQIMGGMKAYELPRTPRDTMAPRAVSRCNALELLLRGNRNCALRLGAAIGYHGRGS
jgi:hypothetical protein